MVFVRMLAKMLRGEETPVMFPLEGGVKGLRVGVVRDYFFDRVEPETVAAFERALPALAPMIRARGRGDRAVSPRY